MGIKENMIAKYGDQYREELSRIGTKGGGAKVPKGLAKVTKAKRHEITSMGGFAKRDRNKSA